MTRPIAKLIIIATSMLVVLPAGSLFAGEYNTVVDIGAPMPEFVDLPATDGTKLSSKDLDEEVVVLVFLANHCPWVKGMDGGLVDLAASLEGKNARVVGVSVNHREDDRLPAMVEHGEKNGYTFTYVYDESQEIGRALGATRTPEYFVFDRDRHLAYMGLLTDSPARMLRDGTINFTKGDPTEFYVVGAVNALLTGKPVEVAETRAQGCSVEYE